MIKNKLELCSNNNCEIKRYRLHVIMNNNVTVNYQILQKSLKKASFFFLQRKTIRRKGK